MKKTVGQKGVLMPSSMQNLPKILHSLPPFNFAGLEEEYSDFSKAKAAVIPVPFDSTTTFRPGARFGPCAVVNASRFIELYDDELSCRPCEEGIATLPEVEPVRGDVKATLDRVKQVVTDVVSGGKFPLLLGGEHSLAFAAVDALAACCSGGENLSVLVFDAHADLWNELEGSPYSYACVTRRIREIVPSVVELGLRALNKDELEYAEENRVAVIKASVLREKGVGKVIGELLPLLKTNVYLSIDLDVFDPSVMPSVDLPEPDGLDWREVTAILKTVASEKNLVGADVCELSPIPGFEAPNFLAAHLAYKILGYKFFLKTGSKISSF